jgi:hypothetical protein
MDQKWNGMDELQLLYLILLVVLHIFKRLVAGKAA